METIFFIGKEENNSIVPIFCVEKVGPLFDDTDAIDYFVKFRDSYLSYSEKYYIVKQHIYEFYTVNPYNRKSYIIKVFEPENETEKRKSKVEKDFLTFQEKIKEENEKAQKEQEEKIKKEQQEKLEMEMKLKQEEEEKAKRKAQRLLLEIENEDKLLGEYSVLKRYYSYNYLIDNLSLIEQFDVDLLCVLITCNISSGLVNNLKILLNVKRGDLESFMVFVERFKTILNYIANPETPLRKFTKPFFENSTIGEEFIYIISRYGNNLFRVLNNFILTDNVLPGTPEERLHLIFNELQDALNPFNQYTFWTDDLKIDAYAYIDLRSKIDPNIFDNVKNEKFFIFLMRLLSDNNSRYRTKCSDIINKYIDKKEFIDYFNTLSEKSINSLSNEDKLLGLYEIFNIDKTYCDEYIKMCKGTLSNKPYLFAELLKIVKSYNFGCDSRREIVEMFCNFAIRNSGKNRKFFNYFIENDAKRYYLFLKERTNGNKNCIDFYNSIKYSATNDFRSISDYMKWTDYSFVKPISYLNEFKSDLWNLINEDIQKIKDKENEKLKEEKRNKASEPNSIIKEFIESDVKFPSYFYERFYPNRNYHEDIEYVKEFFSDTYNLYLEKINSATSQRFAILNKTASKLRETIEKSKYKLSIIDFLKIYNPETIDNLKKYFEETVLSLSYDNKRVLRNYYNKNICPLIPVNCEKAFEEVTIVKGYELTEKDKRDIFDYMKRNNLPWLRRVYKELYRLYVNNEIDFSIPFKEWKKESMEKEESN